MPSPPQTVSAASRVAAAGEHRQPGQQGLFGPGEQLEGPVDGGPQRLVPCHRAAPAGRQDGEAALQPPGQFGRGHRGHPRRRQLDRQRDPIQAADHRGDRRGVLPGHLETGLDRGRALGEQPHRLRLRDRRQVGARLRHPQRGHRKQMFSLDPQALAAGRQDHQPLTRPRQRPGQRRRPLEQVLAVVQHQQQPFGAQELRQRLTGVLAGPGGQREHRRDRIIDPGHVADRGQLSEPRAVGEPRRHLGGGLQPQPGLAHPAGTGQRHHPRPAQCGHGLLQLTLPADERAHRHRQIPGALSNSADRRELGRAGRRGSADRSAPAGSDHAAGTPRAASGQTRRPAARPPGHAWSW